MSTPYEMGLWRSWERASMAWKRSSVRSRPGPPIPQQLAIPPRSAWPYIRRKFLEYFRRFSFQPRIDKTRSFTTTTAAEWIPGNSLSEIVDRVKVCLNTADRFRLLSAQRLDGIDFGCARGRQSHSEQRNCGENEWRRYEDRRVPRFYPEEECGQ